MKKLLAILTGLLLFTSVATAENIWDAIRVELKINPDLSRPEVQTELRWLLAHPGFIHKVTNQSKPYIYHILTEIKKRNMPGEIALLPMIESAYDPFAYSGAGAAGLWQLMPATGSNLGLKQDWWHDSRRSIGDSTNAALNYLSKLNHFFNNDWLFAIAAYDAGEGTIQKAIKNSGQNLRYVSFWTTPVPTETRQYVPRLLALAEIIRNPKLYHIDLPDIPYEAYFKEVDVGSQIDLTSAAKLAGISYKDLIKLNPHFNHWTTAPNTPFKLLIPTKRVDSFYKNLALMPHTARVNFTKYQVKNADNLQNIAQRFHTTVNLIKDINQLSNNNLKKGQIVLIPSPKNTLPLVTINSPPAEHHFIPNSSLHKIIHITQNTDSVDSIAAKYQVRREEIYQWNHLAKNAKLKHNQILIVYKSLNAKKKYIVKSGDSLSKIAQLNHTSTQQLLRLNPNIHNQVIKPKQVILVG